MTYEAWRIQFQDSEQAARAAFAWKLKDEFNSVSEKLDVLIKYSESGVPSFLSLPLREKQKIWKDINFLIEYREYLADKLPDNVKT